MERKMRLEIEELEERIAPGKLLTVAIPGFAAHDGGPFTAGVAEFPVADAAGDGGGAGTIRPD